MAHTNIGVLVSGGGTNLQSIIDQIHFGPCDATISCVISNKANAYALTRAQNANIPNQIINHKDYQQRSDFEKALLEVLNRNDVDILILAGFMRILSGPFIQHYLGKSLNIHPSLLPDFPGLNTHQRALDTKKEKHGCSVHFVTGELDGGPLILQASVPILANDNVQSLASRVLEKEHIIYPRCIEWLCTQKISLRNGSAYYEDTLLKTPLQLEQL